MNMRLPGEAHTEFVLLLPMVPSQRENMIAWLRWHVAIQPTTASSIV